MVIVVSQLLGRPIVAEMGNLILVSFCGMLLHCSLEFEEVKMENFRVIRLEVGCQSLLLNRPGIQTELRGKLFTKYQDEKGNNAEQSVTQSVSISFEYFTFHLSLSQVCFSLLSLVDAVYQEQQR